MIRTINDAWGWTGATPSVVVNTNKFGNIIFIDTDNIFWRITPEELSCEIIAHTPEEYNELIKNEDFEADWLMESLVEEAVLKYGKQAIDRCFCLKLSPVFGGSYDIENVGTLSRTELIGSSGDLAEQIKDVPDGETVSVNILE